MNILSLLDSLEDELDKGRSVPFMGKYLVDRDACLEIIRQIRINLPEEIKQAEMIRQERQRILIDAQKEAEITVQEAENRIKTLIDENEITKRAYQRAQEIVVNAQRNAKEIRLGAKEYADEILAELQEIIEENLRLIHKNRSELKGNLK